MLHVRSVLATLVLALAVLVAVATPAALAGSDDGSEDQPATPAMAVMVATNAASYAPGDPVTASVTNGTPTPIAPAGGIVCQGTPWPFGLQQLDDTGMWQDVAYPRTPPCVGIAVALLEPGASQTRTFAGSSDPGEFRVVYNFRSTDGGEGAAASAAFLVLAP